MHFGPTAILLLKLLLAAALGGLVGLEREMRRKPAGLRTSMFICLGSALFTLLSTELAQRFGDPSSTRIASSLIPGIGFLGAGAIIRERGSVVGLTTAATIFVLAGVGMAVGAGMYSLAVLTVLLILVVLVALGWLQDRFSLKTRRLTFRLTTTHLEDVMMNNNQILAEMKILMQRFQVFRFGADSVLEFDAEVSHSQQDQLSQRLSGLGVRCEIVDAQND